MQHKQYQAHDQGNMNESRRYVKCEESKQPKKNQDNGNDREHVFISLLVRAKDIWHFVFLNYADVSLCAEEHCTKSRVVTGRKDVCLVVDTSVF
jgi:hypothetical protein